MVFEMGTGVAVGADGVVYTISRDVDHWAAHPLAMSRYRGRGTVARWDASGRFLGTFGDDREFIGPHSMYVDPEGFVWVVDREGHQVVKLTPDGEAVLTLGEYAVFGDDEGHFNGPTGIAFLPDGRRRRLRRLLELAAGLVRRGRQLPEGDRRPRRRPPANWRFRTPSPSTRPAASSSATCAGTALHPYVTAPGQIAPERLEPVPGCVSRFEVFTREGEYVGPWDGVPEPGLPLSVAVYGDRIYAGVTGSEPGRQDLVAVDAETDDEVFRIPNANVYVHQMAMAPNGDIYVASVYPEHGGEPRGTEGAVVRALGGRPVAGSALALAG